MTTTPVFFLSCGLLISVLIFAFFLKQKKISDLNKLRQDWGKKKDKTNYYGLVSNYVSFDLQSKFFKLTEQTIKDIDIEKIFELVDRTQTTIGQQYLYSKLVQPSLDINELNERKNNTSFFLQNEEQRNKCQQTLLSLEKRETNRVCSFLSASLIKAKYSALYKFLSVLACLSIMITWFVPKLVIFIIFLFGVNLLTHLVLRYNNSDKLKAIKQVYAALNTVTTLSKFELPIKYTAQEAHTTFKSFRKAFRALDFGIPADDISLIIFYLLDLVKAFFLIEVHLLNVCHNEVVKNKAALNYIFDYIGKIDMSISTASVLFGEKKTSVPIFTENRYSAFCDGILHPLVENCIPNTVAFENNLFITGSNMSGKSTFLKAILVNAVLSQSIVVCFAKSYNMPLLKLQSSIKISDSIETESSYYFQEVNVIKEMVSDSGKAYINLFVIDEIFKGTNTVERVAISKAVLHYLGNANSIVVASSHDIELVKLIDKKFKCYHFTERVKDKNLNFDFLLKEGPLTTRNAIKIIELANYPDDIVCDAKMLAQDLIKNSNSDK